MYLWTKLEKLHENPRIEENEKKLSKVPRVTYNEFENSLEHDLWFGDISSNLAIPTKSNWWCTNDLYNNWGPYHETSYFYSYLKDIFLQRK